MAAFTEYFNGAATGINAVGTTTTGTVLDVSMREQIALVFTANTWASGSGVFTVDASNDGTNWVTSIAMANAVGTTSTTYVTSKTLGSATSDAMYLPFFPYKLLRIVCTVSGTGTYTATVEGQGS